MSTSRRERSAFVQREASEPREEKAPAPVVYQLDRDASRAVDRLALERFGLPSIVLMENAAIHLAQETLALVSQAVRPGVLIVCGCGNNGGDGFALARHLSNAGVEPTIVLIGDAERLAADARINHQAASAIGMQIRQAIDLDERPGVIVDAIFGTGLTRAPEGASLEAIESILKLRNKGSLVLSVDIPSGLDADAGTAPGASVVADVTVTFAGVKKGFAELSAQEYLGEVVVADIGVPRSLVEEMGEPLSPPPGQPDDDSEETDPHSPDRG